MVLCISTSAPPSKAEMWITRRGDLVRYQARCAMSLVPVQTTAARLSVSNTRSVLWLDAELSHDFLLGIQSDQQYRVSENGLLQITVWCYKTVRALDVDANFLRHVDIDYMFLAELIEHSGRCRPLIR